MKIKEFIDEMIQPCDENSFCELKSFLFDNYIKLSALKVEELTVSVLKEKLYDYFEKAELKSGKDFDDIIEKYMDNLDSIVERMIAEEPKAKKNEPMPEMPRARKYYEKAHDTRKLYKENRHAATDVTRIMISLYAEAIGNKGHRISDFDYSTDNIEISKILDALKNERATFGSKKKFDLHDPYGMDNCFFVILIVIWFHIVDRLK